MLSKVFVANKVFATNEVGNVEDDDKLIKKYEKLSKTRKLFKLKNSKNKRLF